MTPGVDKSRAVRRILKANRLVADLGHNDPLPALEHAVEMRDALRVLHTWCSVPGAFDEANAKKLCERALRMNAPTSTQDKEVVHGA